MIEAVLIFNIHGMLRLTKFYRYYTEQKQQMIVKEIHQLLNKRAENTCNFVEAGDILGDKNLKIIFRNYATLYIVFCVDSSESELGILDLIQVFVETLDKTFNNVCELDLVFHMDKQASSIENSCNVPNICSLLTEHSVCYMKTQWEMCAVKVHFILNEIVTGGLVAETTMPSILQSFEEQNKLEKNEARKKFVDS